MHTTHTLGLCYVGLCGGTHIKGASLLKTNKQTNKQTILKQVEEAKN